MHFAETAESIGPAVPQTAFAEFSLVAGGPLFRVLCRLKLADGALGYVNRRITVAALITWLPLLLLSMVEGYAWSGVRVRFFPDASLHLRLLVALPLLIAAEPVLHDWMRPLANRFIERGIIVGSARPGFETAVAAANRLRDSVYPELIIAIVVLSVGISVNWHRTVVLQDSTWYWTMQGGHGESRSRAGGPASSACHCFNSFFSVGIFVFSSGRNSSGACRACHSDSPRHNLTVQEGWASLERLRRVFGC